LKFELFNFSAVLFTLYIDPGEVAKGFDISHVLFAFSKLWEESHENHASLSKLQALLREDTKKVEEWYRAVHNSSVVGLTFSEFVSS
jgi:hypothetical protein